MAEVNKTEEGFISLNGFKLFENVGDSLEGRYIASSIMIMNNQEVKQHTFLTETGLVKFNSTAQLDVIEHLPKGSYIRITYKGVTKGSPVKMYDIAMREADFRAMSNRLALPEPGIE